MKTLPTEFTKLGFTHRQIERAGNVAIFERKKPSHSQPHFEVIRIRTEPPYDRFGKHYPATEHYPSSESWGIHGFTCRTLTEAQSRAANLIALRSSKQNA